MNNLTSLVVAIMGLAAVVLPFIRPRIGLLPFEAKDVERASGPRRPRTIIYALVLLVLICVGIWAIFLKNGPGSYWFGLLGGFIVLLMVTIIVPQGAARRFCLKLLEYWLVALTIAMLISSLAELWVAGSESQAILPGSRRIWIGAPREAFGFWYSVLLSGICVYATLAGLREYFTRIFERRGSNNRLSTDASGSALERTSPASQNRNVGRHRIAYCPNCATEISAEAAECGRCGALFVPGGLFKPVPERPHSVSFVASPSRISNSEASAGPVPFGFIGAVLIVASLGSFVATAFDPFMWIQALIGVPFYGEQHASDALALQFLLFVAGAYLVLLAIIRRLARRDRNAA